MISYRVSFDTGHQHEVAEGSYQDAILAAHQWENQLGTRADRRITSLWYQDPESGEWRSGASLLIPVLCGCGDELDARTGQWLHRDETAACLGYEDQNSAGGASEKRLPAGDTVH